MDRTQACEACNVGSIPTGRTSILVVESKQTILLTCWNRSSIEPSLRANWGTETVSFDKCIHGPTGRTI